MDDEPRVGAPSDRREVVAENTDPPPFGLKRGLFDKTKETIEFVKMIAAAGLGGLVIFLIIGLAYGYAIDIGLIEGGGSLIWLVFFGFIGTVWLYGQWLKARFGRPNYLFRPKR